MVVFAYMASKQTTLNELGEMLGHVVEHMATKEDIKDMATKDDVRAIVKDEIALFGTGLDQRFEGLHAEIRSIRVELDELMEKFENVAGYRKEIDHALERVAAIERHIGMKPKLAA